MLIPFMKGFLQEWMWQAHPRQTPGFSQAQGISQVKPRTCRFERYWMDAIPGPLNSPQGPLLGEDSSWVGWKGLGQGLSYSSPHGIQMCVSECPVLCVSEAQE